MKTKQKVFYLLVELLIQRNNKNVQQFASADSPSPLRGFGEPLSSSVIGNNNIGEKMTHKEKLNKMFDELSKKGINKNIFAPPIYRLLWKIGIEIPPPLFSSFMSIFLFSGIFFGLLWGLLMWILLWRPENLPIAIAVIGSAMAGVLFGLSIAAILRRKAKKYNLPLWKDYGKD